MTACKIIDITNPRSPSAVSAIDDDADGFTKLHGPLSTATIAIGSSSIADTALGLRGFVMSMI